MPLQIERVGRREPHQHEHCQRKGSHAVSVTGLLVSGMTLFIQIRARSTLA
jgi:hypothetical protein